MIVKITKYTFKKKLKLNIEIVSYIFFVILKQYFSKSSKKKDIINFSKIYSCGNKNVKSTFFVKLMRLKSDDLNIILITVRFASS